LGTPSLKIVVVTTPNIEYNLNYPTLAAGCLRHPDHRFEWTRSEFASWVKDVSLAYGYDFKISFIGDICESLGGPTQMAVFKLGKGDAQ
jgi:hypothetical protein